MSVCMVGCVGSGLEELVFLGEGNRQPQEGERFSIYLNLPSCE